MFCVESAGAAMTQYHLLSGQSKGTKYLLITLCDKSPTRFDQQVNFFQDYFIKQFY